MKDLLLNIRTSKKRCFICKHLFFDVGLYILLFFFFIDNVAFLWYIISYLNCIFKTVQLQI